MKDFSNFYFCQIGLNCIVFNIKLEIMQCYITLLINKINQILEEFDYWTYYYNFGFDIKF